MDSTDSVIVRRFVESDAPELLELMKELAVFEGYIEDFRVTEGDLCHHGLGENPRFIAYVAMDSRSQSLEGMAVTYLVPWTYDLRPTLVLKELFVRRASRGRKIGERLLRRVARLALKSGAPRLVWQVLGGNSAAANFYDKLGGQHDRKWQNWQLSSSELGALAIRRINPRELSELH